MTECREVCAFSHLASSFQPITVEAFQQQVVSGLASYDADALPVSHLNAVDVYELIRSLDQVVVRFLLQTSLIDFVSRIKDHNIVQRHCRNYPSQSGRFVPRWDSIRLPRQRKRLAAPHSIHCLLTGTTPRNHLRMMDKFSPWNRFEPPYASSKSKFYSL